MRKFEIVTLSDRQNFQNLGDPITILTGTVGVLSSIFPNIFGGGRKRLTPDMWREMLPGSGYWSTKLRTYLATRIHYDVDVERNILPFTMQFVADNNQEICPGTYTFQNPPGTNPGGGGVAGWQPCYQTLIAKINQEKSTGGNAPIGQTPGGFGSTLDYSTLVPIAIGGVVLVALMKSKKKK